MIHSIAWIAALALVLATTAGCHDHPSTPGVPDHGEGGHDHDEAILAYTGWTELSELFVEFAPMVVGQESSFAVHLTVLEQFAAVREGRLRVRLVSNDHPEESFEAAAISRPGIFVVGVKPAHAGRRRVLIEWEANGRVDTHDLGAIAVFTNAHDAAHAPTPPPAEISFLKEQQWRVRFGTAPVVQRAVSSAARFYATLEARPTHRVEVAAPASGRLRLESSSVFVPGAGVVAGQKLATIVLLTAGEGGDDISLDLRLERARLGLDEARRELARLQHLHEQGAIATSRLEEATREQTEASAVFAAAQEAIRRRRASGGSAGSHALHTPIAGVIEQVLAVPGQRLAEGQPVVIVADTSRLWLELQIPAARLPTLPAQPSVAFQIEGEPALRQVAPDAWRTTAAHIEPTSRTAAMIFEIDSADAALRPGMVATAYLSGQAGDEVLAVPRSAIVNEAGLDIVYVQVSGEGFERRVVRTGASDAEWIAITDGLTRGERVVTEGAYLVRLAAAAGGLPSHGHSH
ncbi:MAG: efflux RND transporter periplasmic adaptor subunit [Bradymonadaceae bacterium]|nr:efflux RND transporter periplasmic adaptor subunit [Lujinxingiaceae bacterium]